ncbi:MAG: hypothetical protein WC473_02820 [Patescibacteria group bacterium]|jgi:hypothetical protein
MPVPYISITDFTDCRQTKAMLTAMSQVYAEKPLSHRLGIGVMMSHKTLRDLPTRYGKVFPTKDKITDIFMSHPLALNTLHFADYESHSWHKTAMDFEETVFWGEPHMQALQLDMIWPDHEVVRDFKRIYPHISVILQINTRAFEEVEEQPEKLLKKLKLYGSALDYVLLDKSMGQGKPLSLPFLQPFLDKLSEQRPDLGLVVAGGLGPETIETIIPLIKKYPQLSIDAQGRLRPSGSIMDPIDWQMAQKYLERAIRLFQLFQLTST